MLAVAVHRLPLRTARIALAFQRAPGLGEIGHTAIVGLQYSFLPSWMSFAIDRQRPAEAGQALFDAVYREWSRLPRETRPKLIVYRLSLGSYAMQSAFATVGSIENQTNGAPSVGKLGILVAHESLRRHRHLLPPPGDHDGGRRFQSRALRGGSLAPPRGEDRPGDVCRLR